MILGSFSKPLLGGAIVGGYKYFTDNGYSKSIQKHLPSAGVAAGAILATDYLFKAWDMDNDNLEGIVKMVSKPASTGALYAAGEKFVLKNNDSIVKNGALGAAACVASGYVTSPVTKYF